MQGLAVGFHTAGKAQQPVGNASCAFHCAFNAFQQCAEPFLVLALAAHLAHAQKILGKPRLFVNDGQRIIDLVGHARSQPPDGRKLLVVLHLGKNSDPAFIAGLQAVYKLLHEQIRNHKDQGNAAAQDQQQFRAQGQPGADGVFRGLDGQQHEIRACQCARGHHELPALGVGNTAHHCFVRGRGQIHGQFFQRLAEKIGIRLQHAFRIYKKHVSVVLRPNGGHNLLDAQGICGHAQRPRNAVFFKPVHCHNKVRIPAIPQNCVAEVAPLYLGIAQPWLARVIHALELVRPHIANLLAVRVHQAHIHKALIFTLEGQKHAVESSLVQQILEGIRVGQKTHSGNTLAKVQFQRRLRFAGQSVYRAFQFALKGTHVLHMADGRKQQ